MSTYGISVSKKNVNVRTIANKDSYFKSEFTTLKILKFGEVAFQTNGSGNGSLSVHHGLGFSPAFYVFRKGTASFSFLDATSYSNSFFPDPNLFSNWISGTFTCYTTTSDLIISASGQSANTIYTFRYYIFIDLAQDFSGEQRFVLKNQYGIEISKSGIDVETSEDYKKTYSNKYKSLQYYTESYKTFSLSLPAIWASPVVDTDVQTGTYVDFNHGLGYPPLFFAFYEDDQALPQSTSVPYVYKGSTVNSIESVDGFCDSIKVRVSFYRRSVWLNEPSPKWDADTIKIKVYIFTENLLIS